MKSKLSPISDLFLTISAPARLEILLIIGESEACVCHLEARLGYRQAYISQHLMALRKAEILQDRREGRYIYYRIKDKAVLLLVDEAARLCGIDLQRVDSNAGSLPDKGCECPHCSFELQSSN